MSLFFEDEIQKVKRNLDRSGLENMMAQDPRTNRKRVNKNYNTTLNQPQSRRNRHDSGQWPNSRWEND